jgi:ribosomal-protein-alanine acetyltransferase
MICNWMESFIPKEDGMAMAERWLKSFAIEPMGFQDLDEVLLMSASSLILWSKNMFLEEMQNPLAHCFMMKREGLSAHQGIGFICFRNIEDESELFNICIHPDYRQLGIGKHLMQFYFDFCCQYAIKTFYLEVQSSNLSAIHLYQQLSYQMIGMRKKFYQGKYDAILMAKKT